MTTTFDPNQTPQVSIAYQNTPNILDNGGCEIFQRGTSNSPIEGQYSVADRWKVASLNGTATFSTSKETGAGNFDSGTSSLKLNLTATGSATLFDLVNYVENFAFYKGKTVSIYARVKSNVATVLRMSDGPNVTTIATHTGSGNFETLQGTFTVSANATELTPVFRNSASAIFTTYIDSVMLVLGSTPIPFVPTNPQVDLARCMRFCQVFPGFATDGNAGPVGTGYTTGTTTGSVFVFLPVPLRALPTVTFNNPSGYIAHTIAGGNIAAATITAAIRDVLHLRFDVTVAGGFTSDRTLVLYSNNATSITVISADL